MNRRSMAIAIVFLLCVSGRAGMGIISVLGDGVRVSESAQRAMIAHDGFEEILILGTDFHATRKTRVVRFIPFPTEPVVKAAPAHCFDSMDVLLRTHGVRYVVAKGNREKAGGPDALGDTVTLLSQTRVASHDVVTILVKDTLRIADQISSILGKAGHKGTKLNSLEETTIKAYVNEGINYFVFDIVEIGLDTTPVAPLLYQFACPTFYYPLQTSNTIGGQGLIQLFVVCNSGRIHNWLLDSGLPRTMAHRSTNAVRIDRFAMLRIAPEIAVLMGSNALLAVFECRGPLLFARDCTTPEPVVRINTAEDLQARHAERELVRLSQPKALDLYAQIAKTRAGNVCFSPHGLWPLLGFWAETAQGSAVTEFRNVLHATSLPDSVFRVAGQGLARTMEGEGPWWLSVSSSVWVQDTLFFEPKHRDAAAAHYGVDVKTIDFRDGPSSTAAHFAGWVKDHVRGFDRRKVPTDVSLVGPHIVLSSAVYYTSLWAHPFDRKTVSQKFHLSPTISKEVPVMRQTGVFPYFADSLMQLLELPGPGERISILVALPRDAVTLEALEGAMWKERWLSQISRRSAKRLVQVAIPSFEIHPKAVVLDNALRAIGLKHAIQDDGINSLGAVRGGQRLVDQVIQIASLKVDVGPYDGPPLDLAAVDSLGAKRRPVEFTADRPFLYMVLNRVNGAILLIGRVVDPTAG